MLELKSADSSFVFAPPPLLSFSTGFSAKIKYGLVEMIAGPFLKINFCIICAIGCVLCPLADELEGF